jgi:hypothetical protein
MKIVNTCCGSYFRKNEATIKKPLPPNPKVQGGIAVIYLGSGNISIKGSATESVYHASDHSRHFRVYAEDIDSVLRNPDIIRKP